MGQVYYVGRVTFLQCMCNGARLLCQESNCFCNEVVMGQVNYVRRVTFFAMKV